LEIAAASQPQIFADPAISRPARRFTLTMAATSSKVRAKLDAAKRLLGESGYAGEPVTLMAAQGSALHKAWGDATVALLKLDIKVDFAAVDLGTVFARRAKKSPPRQGGWQMHLNSYYGVDYADPSSSLLRADGSVLGNGWANNPQIEAEVAAWYDATSLDEEKTIVRRLNRLALDHVLYAPLGAVLRHYAWRKDVSGIGQAPLPIFWGVSKTT
jgi:peptide/nickel transport system substrate-binding protein